MENAARIIEIDDWKSCYHVVERIAKTLKGRAFEELPLIYLLTEQHFPSKSQRFGATPRSHSQYWMNSVSNAEKLGLILWPNLKRECIRHFNESFIETEARTSHT